MISFILPLLITNVFAASPVVKAADFDIAVVEASGKVEFLAVGRPSAIKIRGKGPGAEGQIQVRAATKTSAADLVATGNFSFNLSAFDTGMETRNEHMKEKYLEVAKFPKAELRFKNLSVPTLNEESIKIPFQADLSLHGVTKPISGTAELTRKEKTLRVHTEFPLKLSEYAIAIPSFAGITVAEDVTVNVEFEAPVMEVTR